MHKSHLINSLNALRIQSAGRMDPIAFANVSSVLVEWLNDNYMIACGMNGGRKERNVKPSDVFHRKRYLRAEN